MIEARAFARRRQPHRPEFIEPKLLPQTVALAALFYDTFLRATGIGWSMGIGRIGAIVGPVVGGILLAAGVTSQSLFVIVGGISLVAAISVLCMGWFVLRARSTDAPSLKVDPTPRRAAALR
ncbi:MAG: aromatic acid/H+ symport family MFS transporter [Betaproteobacteria bacterium]|nr:MAG: aromatic acid/H+ symport family MFS transporter [Betaproteobacteria bacterium]